jgi:DNA modification methylase
LKDFISLNTEIPDLFIAEAHNLNHLKDNSIDLVVTSPPFLNIVNYKLDNWMRNWFAGIDENINISHIANLNEWTEMIHKVIKELARVIKPGGFLAFEVGEVKGGKYALEKNVWNCMTNLPFKRLGILVNQQNFTKTANCWGVSNNQSGVNTNRVVVAQKF